MIGIRTGFEGLAGFDWEVDFLGFDLEKSFSFLSIHSTQ